MTLLLMPKILFIIMQWYHVLKKGPSVNSHCPSQWYKKPSAMLQRAVLDLKTADLKSRAHTLGLYIKMHTLAVCREGNVLYVWPISTCSITLLGSVIFLPAANTAHHQRPLNWEITVFLSFRKECHCHFSFLNIVLILLTEAK